MRTSFRKYRPFFSSGAQAIIAYRTNWLLYRFGDMMGAFVVYFLWQAVFDNSTKTSLGGFTLDQMSMYVFLSFFTGLLTFSGVSGAIGEEIKDGSIAMRLIKPVSFTMTYLFNELGSKVVQLLALIVPLMGGLTIFQLFHSATAPFHPLNLLFFLISATLGYLINFYFNVCFGFLAFVLQNLWGSSVMKNAVVAFMSGQLIPLTFFPAFIGQILQVFPFAGLIYTSVMIYLGQYNAQNLVKVLILQLFWLLFFGLLSKVIWRVIIGHLSIQGG